MNTVKVNYWISYGCVAETYGIPFNAEYIS